jgi:hypothetical protein
MLSVGCRRLIPGLIACTFACAAIAHKTSAEATEEKEYLNECSTSSDPDHQTDRIACQILEAEDAFKKKKETEEEVEKFKAYPEAERTIQDAKKKGDETDGARTSVQRAKALDLMREYRKYRAKERGSLLTENLWFKGRGGWANADGDRNNANGVQMDLDGTEFDAGLDLGYYKRPLLRDILMRASDRPLGGYASWVASKRPRTPDKLLYWGLVDAIKVDFYGGYGRVVKDPHGSDNSGTDSKGTFNAKLLWEIPLHNFVEKNPFD